MVDTIKPQGSSHMTTVLFHFSLTDLLQLMLTKTTLPSP